MRTAVLERITHRRNPVRGWAHDRLLDEPRAQGPGRVGSRGVPRREVAGGLGVPPAALKRWRERRREPGSCRRPWRPAEVASDRLDEQEVPVLSLHLLQLPLVYANTLMIQEVLLAPSWSGRLTEEDLRGLTPLIFGHVNPYGRFEPDMEERLPAGDAARVPWIAAPDGFRNSTPKDATGFVA